MCGIAGIVSENTSLIQKQSLQKMSDVLQHRGPDGAGIWINEQHTVGFAHRRLSIIDLSAAAAQPLHYLHYTIIFNGEIYNYKELKAELKSFGYSFFTNSDTEVITAAYDKWRTDCVNHFDGMFAFALYDLKEQLVFLARDRFGEKPLYYNVDYFERGKFSSCSFASEMKALWALGLPKNLNGTILLNYITEGYAQNPIKKTETFFSNIYSLPPGNFLLIFIQEKKIQMRKWYKPILETVLLKDESVIIEKFKQLFFTSVNRRLRSDVSTGVSLSGGIDSSSIAAAIHENKKDSLQWKDVCFTASFPGFEKDETEKAKVVAKHFGLNQFLITATADECIKHFNELMYYQEEPVQSSSVFTQFLLYKKAKTENISVLLDGQGADEILAGYEKYLHWYLQSLFKTNRKVFFKEKELLSTNNFNVTWNWKNYFAAYFPERAAEKLQANALKKQQNNNFIEREFLFAYQNKDSLQKPVIKNMDDILYYNTFHLGLEELLRYADRNSMASSREVRLPFLFHELVEFVFTISWSYKIKNGFTKWPLRKAMENYLPANIVWQKGKTGFEPPQKKWMENKNFQEMIFEARKKLVSKSVLNKDALSILIAPKHAHDKDNFDWRFLCAAALF